MVVELNAKMQRIVLCGENRVRVRVVGVAVTEVVGRDS